MSRVGDDGAAMMFATIKFVRARFPCEVWVSLRSSPAVSNPGQGMAVTRAVDKLSGSDESEDCQTTRPTKRQRLGLSSGAAASSSAVPQVVALDESEDCPATRSTKRQRIGRSSGAAASTAARAQVVDTLSESSGGDARPVQGSGQKRKPKQSCRPTAEERARRLTSATHVDGLLRLRCRRGCRLECFKKFRQREKYEELLKFRRDWATVQSRLYCGSTLCSLSRHEAFETLSGFCSGGQTCEASACPVSGSRRVFARLAQTAWHGCPGLFAQQEFSFTAPLPSKLTRFNVKTYKLTNAT